MSQKTKTAYESCIKTVLDIIGAYNIKVSLVDFETELRQAIEAQLSRTVIAGCSYHYEKVSKFWLELSF